MPFASAPSTSLPCLAIRAWPFFLTDLTKAYWTAWSVLVPCGILSSPCWPACLQRIPGRDNQLLACLSCSRDGRRLTKAQGKAFHLGPYCRDEDEESLAPGHISFCLCGCISGRLSPFSQVWTCCLPPFGSKYWSVKNQFLVVVAPKGFGTARQPRIWLVTLFCFGLGTCTAVTQRFLRTLEDI